MKKKGQKQKIEKQPVEKDSSAATEPSVDAYDEEVNSGFGSYLRSATGEKDSEEEEEREKMMILS